MAEELDHQTKYLFSEMIVSTPDLGKSRVRFRFNPLDSIVLESEGILGESGSRSLKVPRTVEYQSLGGGKWKKHPVVGCFVDGEDPAHVIEMFAFSADGKYHVAPQIDSKLYEGAKNNGLYVENISL